jgi:hypothetical protein
MTPRRSLVAGLAGPPEATDEDRERQFVYADRPAPTQPAPKQATAQETLSRAPLTTRIRGDYVRALKRASLERQLGNIEPNTLQDILEEAIGPWLQENGYLTE